MLTGWCRRFHAWQSSLVFTVIFIIHLVFAWSTFLSWLIIIGDLALMGFLALKAYRDADTLDRSVLPPPFARPCLRAQWSEVANTTASDMKFPRSGI